MALEPCSARHRKSWSKPLVDRPNGQLPNSTENGISQMRCWLGVIGYTNRNCADSLSSASVTAVARITAARITAARR